MQFDFLLRERGDVATNHDDAAFLRRTSADAEPSSICQLQLDQFAAQQFWRNPEQLAGPRIGQCDLTMCV